MTNPTSGNYDLQGHLSTYLYLLHIKMKGRVALWELIDLIGQSNIKA